MRTLLFALLIVWAPLSLAVIETYEFSDPQLELRYQALSAELRCPKCQNQNIADSNAPIAQDLRRTLYQQLERGSSDEEILDFMVARYGEFVRYRPSFSAATAVLWFAPLLLLLLAGIVVWWIMRGRDSAPAELSAEERARLDSLLSEEREQQ